MQLSRLTYPPLHQVRVSPCKLHCYRLPAYGRCTSLCCRSWLCQVPLTWTKRPETLSFWVFLTRPLPQIHLHPVSCDHSRIESSLETLRWREPQPPEVTAGIKMADTQSCTYWLSAAVGRLSFSQVRSEIQLGHSIYSWDFSIVAPRSSKKDLPVVVVEIMGWSWG